MIIIFRCWAVTIFLVMTCAYAYAENNAATAVKNCASLISDIRRESIDTFRPKVFVSYFESHFFVSFGARSVVSETRKTVQYFPIFTCAVEKTNVYQVDYLEFVLNEDVFIDRIGLSNLDDGLFDSPDIFEDFGAVRVDVFQLDTESYFLYETIYEE